MQLGLGISIARPAIVTVPAMFLPTDYGAKLRGWPDAGRAEYLTINGGRIAGLVDPIAEVEFTQAFSSQRPIQQGKNAAFDSNDDFLNYEGMAWGSDPFEIQALVRQDALAASTGRRQIVGYGGAGSVGQCRLGRIVSGGVNRGEMVTATTVGGAVTVAGSTVDLSGIHHLNGRFAADSNTLTVDGNVNGPFPSVLEVGTVRTRIGASSLNTAGNIWHGLWRASVITDLLDPEEYEALESWRQMCLADIPAA